MTFEIFIIYIQYYNWNEDTACPARINPVRWAAMINSAKKNGFFPEKAQDRA